MAARRPGAHRDVSSGIGGRDRRSPDGVCPRSEQRFRDLRAQLIARLLPRGPSNRAGVRSKQCSRSIRQMRTSRRSKCNADCRRNSRVRGRPSSDGARRGGLERPARHSTGQIGGLVGLPSASRPRIWPGYCSSPPSWNCKRRRWKVRLSLRRQASSNMCSCKWSNSSDPMPLRTNAQSSLNLDLGSSDVGSHSCFSPCFIEN